MQLVTFKRRGYPQQKTNPSTATPPLTQEATVSGDDGICMGVLVRGGGDPVVSSVCLYLVELIRINMCASSTMNCNSLVHCNTAV